MIRLCRTGDITFREAKPYGPDAAVNAHLAALLGNLQFGRSPDALDIRFGCVEFSLAITSPKFKTNSHEVEMIGSFGKMVTKTENVACPDNPKTSYLAALSGLQILKQYCNGIFIGT